jgi:amino acid transporter
MSGPMLLLTVFCCVSGGPFGLEPVISESGAGLGILLILLTPLLWALPDAITTAELAPAIPVEGGYVIWVKRALGPFVGFLNAWWTWLYALVDAAIYPVMFTTYLSALLQWAFQVRILEDYPIASYGVSLAMVVVFTALNIRGTRLVGQTSSVFAILLILPFLVMVLVGLGRFLISPHSVAVSFIPEGETVQSAFSAGLATVLWNYLGWDALSTVAEEVDEPAKAYPRAMMFGLVLVTAIYLFPSIVGLLYLPDSSQWVEGSWPAIAEKVGGPGLSLAVNLVGLVSPMALFAATVLGSSRIPFVLAEDGFLPKSMVAIHPRFGTPWVALLASGGVYAFLISKQFQELVTLNVILYGSALILESTALCVLRKKEPNLHRPFKVPGGRFGLAAIVVLPAFWVTVLVVTSIQEEGWRAQVPTAIALLSGPILYGLIKGKR